MRSEFARVTAGFDVRGFRLDARRLNGGGMLNSGRGCGGGTVSRCCRFADAANELVQGAWPSWMTERRCTSAAS